MKRSNHIYRWDMDKTYLQTDFDSIGALIRTALQRPEDKTNVPGSAELIKALRTDAQGRAEIYFISGSPKQMRAVLSEKLQLDGVDFDGFVLKDNLRNIMKGRLRAVKEQIGYKLPALLHARNRVKNGALETLFGDDAERDALVYSLYADLAEERVGAAELDRVLSLAGVYPDSRRSIFEALDSLEPSRTVERVIIHLDRKSPPVRFEAYGRRVVPVYNYFQAALVLHADGRMREKSVHRLRLKLMGTYGLSDHVLSRSVEDVVRRGALKTSQLEVLRDGLKRIGAENQFLESALSLTLNTCDVELDSTPDYASLLTRELQRRRIEKARRGRWPFRR